MKQGLKRLSKIIFKSPAARKIMCYFLAGVIHFIRLTSRVTIHIHPDAAHYYPGEKHAIFTFWHGRLLMMGLLRPPARPMHAMVSIHRDGEWLAQTIRFLGVNLVRGSSHKGGSAAAREALQALEAQENLGITPDGPRGPFQQAQMGAVTLARLTQTPIIPCAFSSSRVKRLNSWDKFMVAKPFGHIHLCIGAPIAPHQNEEQDESMRLKMQEAISTETKHADTLAGQANF